MAFVVVLFIIIIACLIYTIVQLERANDDLRKSEYYARRFYEIVLNSKHDDDV